MSMFLKEVSFVFYCNIYENIIYSSDGKAEFLASLLQSYIYVFIF